jgi:hypothetical protein
MHGKSQQAGSWIWAGQAVSDTICPVIANQ